MSGFDLGMLRQFLKYCFVGILNTGITYLVYAVFIHFRCAPWVGLILGYVCGMGTSYLVNGRWTFASSALTARTLLKFILINSIILATGEIDLHLLLHVMVASPYVAQLINTIPITLVGYLLNRMMVFRPSPTTGMEDNVVHRT